MLSRLCSGFATEPYEEAVAELLKSKQAGKPMKDEPSEKASNVVNLMDALRRSVSAEKAGSNDKKAASAKKPAAKPKSAKKPVTKTKARKAG